MKVTKEFNFCYGHRLSNYEGKCFNMHGHNGIVKITVSGELDSQGMVLDFGKLKEIYNKVVDSKFDHKMILKTNDSINEAIGKIMPESIYWVNYNPTAENMAQDIFNIIYNELLEIYKSNLIIKLEKVAVYETPTSYAEVENE